MLIPFGLDDARISRIPRATIAILGACVLLQLLSDYAGGPLFRLAFLTRDGAGQIGWLTATFVHFGWWHLFWNMLVLVLVCGPFVEDAWGSRVFAAFFLVAGVVSLAAQAAALQGEAAAIAGASGSIAACLGAFAVRFSRRKVRIFWTWGLLVAKPTFQISARLWVLFGLSLDLLAAVKGTGGDVAVTAHVAGYLFGASIALAASRWRWEDRLLRAEGGWSIGAPAREAMRLRRKGRLTEARALLARSVEACDSVDFAALELAREELAAGRPDAAATALARIAGSAFVSRPALAAVVSEVGPARLRPAAALRIAEDIEEYDRKLALELADRGAEAGGRLAARALVLGVRLALQGREPHVARERAGRALAAPNLSPDLRRQLEGLQREAERRTELSRQA
jgi:membrane associated rhomboid family serine protease